MGELWFGMKGTEGDSCTFSLFKISFHILQIKRLLPILPCSILRKYAKKYGTTILAHLDVYPFLSNKMRGGKHFNQSFP